MCMEFCSHLNVCWLGHLAQQLQGLLLQGLIRVLQAVDDSDLVLGRILGVYAHDPGKPVNACVLQVVAGGSQECGDHLCRCT